MTEPKVSYKGLEECTTDFLVQRMVVAILIATIFSSLCGEVDAITPTTAASADLKGVDLTRTQHSPMMLNDSSVPADDFQDFSSSSYSASDDNDYSLPLTVEVEEDDDDEICSANQYLDHSMNACMNCTTCGPGTQHKIDQKCGYGNGFEQICEACDDGRDYQDRSSSSLARCQPCITCDKLADTIQECSPVHNAQCGPCPSGKYYFYPNVCIDCEDGDSRREECSTTTPTTPVLTTNSTSPSSTTTDALPVELIITSVTVVTPSNRTESPTTEQTTNGGERRIDVDGGVIVVCVTIPLCIGACVVLKLLMTRWRRRGEEACTSEKDAENGSNGGDPGVKSVQVCFNVKDETIRYVPVSQQELSQDGTDLSLPQTLRSDLPFAHPPGFAIYSCNGPAPLGQDAPQARLPGADEAVPL